MSICTLKHHDHTSNCFGSIHHECSITRGMPVLNLSNIPYQNRNSCVAIFYHYFPDIFKVFYLPDTTNEEGGWLFINIGTAGILIIFFQCIENVGECQVKSPKTPW